MAPDYLVDGANCGVLYSIVLMMEVDGGVGS